MQIFKYKKAKQKFKKYFNSFIRVVTIISIFFTFYYFFKTPVYTSQLTFYSTYQDNQDASSILNPLGGLIGLNSGSLDFSVSDYIKSDKMLGSVLASEYTVEGQKISLVELWVGDFDKKTLNPIKTFFRFNTNLKFNNQLTIDDKKMVIAKEILSNKIKFSENRISSLYSITVTVPKHPTLSKQILDNIYDSIIRYTNEIENSKASEKISFINDRLLQVGMDLKNAENEHLIFLEKNKSLNSPALVLNRDRIQRKIDLHDEVFKNLSNQLEIAKINQKDNTSSIFLLDSAQVPSKKNGDSLILSLLKVIILAFTFFVVFIFYKSSVKVNE